MAAVKRRLFTFAAAVSLLLCLGTVALWSRSYNTSDHLNKQSVSHTPTEFRGHVLWLGSSRGRLAFVRREDIYPSNLPGVVQIPTRWEHVGIRIHHEPPLRFDRETFTPPGHDKRSWEGSFGGMQFLRLLRDPDPEAGDPRSRFRDTSRYVEVSRIRGWALIVPHAHVAALLAVLPVVALLKWWRRPGRGNCRTCGYDLTGNTSGMCPECGTAVAGQAAQ